MDGSTSVGWLASLIIYKRRAAVYIINSASSLCLRKNVVNLSLLFYVHTHTQLSLWGLFICYSKLFLLGSSSSGGGSESVEFLNYYKDGKGLFFAFSCVQNPFLFHGIRVH